jgi:hypothetical protein
MLIQNAKADEKIEIAFEYYAHHYVIGTKPLEVNPNKTFKITYHNTQICIKNDSIWDFYFNLKIVNSMVDSLGDSSFRRAELINVLKRVHETLYYDFI